MVQKNIKYVHIRVYTCRYSQYSEDTPVTAVQNFLQATTLSDDSLRVSYMYKYMYMYKYTYMISVVLLNYNF